MSELLPQYSRTYSSGNSVWIIFSPGETHAVVAKSTLEPLLGSLGSDIRKALVRSFLIGELPGGEKVLCGELSQSHPLPDTLEWLGFRDIYTRMNRSYQSPVSRAKQLLNWDRTHQFCGVCGKQTQVKDQEPCRFCPSCGEMYYPRLAPAVIVRITRGNRIMLAHNKNFPEGIYSHIAGFVEAGETLEEAVKREVREEVGLEIENLRLFGSQPWPMPYSLMIAFTAECPEGDPEPDGVEIEDARWFTPDTLPMPPTSGSIAMAMLQDFISGNRPG